MAWNSEFWKGETGTLHSKFSPCTRNAGISANLPHIDHYNSRLTLAHLLRQEVSLLLPCIRSYCNHLDIQPKNFWRIWSTNVNNGITWTKAFEKLLLSIGRTKLRLQRGASLIFCPCQLGQQAPLLAAAFAPRREKTL